jgi:hypothetical protein
MTEETMPVGIVKRKNDPLLNRFEDIEKFVGTNPEGARLREEAKKWYEVRRSQISEALMQTVSRTPKGKKRFRVKTSMITFGSGKLAADVVELVAEDLATTGYECELKSHYLYFSPIKN